ncbi:unnamed protein product [Sphenostylis stenocarpa]|uniref:Uncharacterized protein n=1 Tax=Sphenostylis stenocarpa TaxID=92480 RepID=A0AA86RWW6_9FABA|nr:unnamed protein product [Sphenostylis stenocarpa]
MSAMVEVWKGELTKLREKVLARKSFFRKGKEGAGDEHAVEKEVLQKDIMAVQRDTTISEATVYKRTKLACGKA